MKPYPGIRCTQAQQNFNRKLSSKRVLIEQAFGLLKGRWRCLYKVMEDYTINVSETIIACCVLHNIYLDRGDHLDGQQMGQVIPNNHPAAPPAGAQAGHAARDAIAGYL